MARILSGQQEEALREAAEVLRSGGLVACPTETFYALAADSAHPRALNRLLALKGRPATKPLLVLVADIAMVSLVVAAVPPLAARLMAAFWPGPLTLILPARPGLPLPLTGDTGTVGVRQPAEPVARGVARHLGRPITGTSANLTGQPPLTTAAAVQAELGEDLDLILEAGPCPGGLPSTIVKIKGAEALLIREGAIPAAVLEQVTGSLGRLEGGKASNEGGEDGCGGSSSYSR